ncbi:MAG: primosomal protein N' [Oceanospirillaceae bacterium]|nr:primosomal protein N' [Oceanospirillaceae bacterium]
MIFLRVAIPSPLRKLFDYLPPVKFQAREYQPGIRLLVPFGHRTLVAILVEVVSQAQVDSHKLKAVLEVIDDTPPQPTFIFDLALWSAQYYQHPIGDALLQALPIHLRKGEKCERVHEYLLHAIENPEQPLNSRAKKQQEAYLLIKQHGEGISADALKAELGSIAAIKPLLEKGLIEKKHRPHIIKSSSEPLREPGKTLNPEQLVAVEYINAQQGYQTFLLDGITGSGKTEVYLQVIEKVLREGKQALVLVPEIGLTPQTVFRFKARFNVNVVYMHSNMSDKARFQAWLQARDGDAKIIIGTRSAIFTPMAHPGIIIIDEEHDQSFKQQDGYRYSARDLSIVRGHGENIPVILGSATPSLESLQNANLKRYHYLALNRRAGNAVPPSVELLDIKACNLNAGMSEPLIEQIKIHLNDGNQVLIFLNRRGFAPSLSCHNCGWIAPCKRCDARLTLHQKPPHLHCHHCGSQKPIPRQCHECNSTELTAQGTGTERAEQALSELFPDFPIWRIDRDSTSRKNSMQEIIDKINQQQPGILLGTQMLAKGHHFAKVSLVAILEADSGLFSTDFRGMERTAQLITQVSGRAGREEILGQVIIQTHHPEHPLLQKLVHSGYRDFAVDEINNRANSDLPPFSHIAIIRAEASNAGRAEAFLQLAQQTPTIENVISFGPFPAPMEKKAGVYRSHLILQSARRPLLQQFLSQFCLQLEHHPLANKVRWSIDVDPYDMF